MPMANGDLTADEKKTVLEAKKKIPQIEAMINKAKKAGIDTEQMELQLGELKKKVQGLHDVYIAPRQTGS